MFVTCSIARANDTRLLNDPTKNIQARRSAATRKQQQGVATGPTRKWLAERRAKKELKRPQSLPAGGAEAAGAAGRAGAAGSLRAPFPGLAAGAGEAALAGGAGGGAAEVGAATPGALAGAGLARGGGGAEAARAAGKAAGASAPKGAAFQVAALSGEAEKLVVAGGCPKRSCGEVAAAEG